MEQKKKILLTGATGYVGAKLLKILQKQGHEINCLARNPDKLKIAGPKIRVFQGDVMIRSSMWKAFQGVDTAYFLVHMLNERKNFENKEIQAAANFAAMARSAGVKRIIYLGALGNEEDHLSPHLQSRQDVGIALRASHIPVLEFRASIVIGKGSLSFEMIRDLTERLPFMVTPRWVSTPAQPIGISDLLSYLNQGKDLKLVQNEIVEIGSADRMSYGQLMKEYARQRGLKRRMLPVPVLSPKLSSHWLAFITHIDPAIGRKLIEGIRNPTIVESPRASELFTIKPCSVKQAMAEALEETPLRETLEGFEHVYVT